MQRDNIPLGLLWEETCESTLAALGQLATTDQCAHRQDCGRMVGKQESTHYAEADPVDCA
jgi:hypothetical protein